MEPITTRHGDRQRAPSLSRRLLALALLALASGCAQLPLPGVSQPKPIADRPIDLAGHCARTEEDGFREDATLRIVDSRVQALHWKLWVGSRGSCLFDLEGFRQVRSRPHIELAARDGSACRLLVWQDPRRVTLAHNGCERRCTPGIYEQAWPVMFDPVTGRCADTR